MNVKTIALPIHCVGEKSQLAQARKLEMIFTALGHKVMIVNLDGSDDPLVIQAYIDRLKPGLLVTIDCSGFDLKLLGDDLYYNSLCVPAMHFLTKSPKDLEEQLSERMNFTTTVYVDSNECKELIESDYWRVPEGRCINGMFTKGMIESFSSTDKVAMDEFVEQARVIGGELERIF